MGVRIKVSELGPVELLILIKIGDDFLLIKLGKRPNWFGDQC